MIVWPAKDPDEVLDYLLDWSARLEQDTIVTSVWTAPEGLSQGDTSNDDTTATIWLSGGVLGQSYDLINRITTSGGRTMEQTVRIRIASK